MIARCWMFAGAMAVVSIGCAAAPESGSTESSAEQDLAAKPKGQFCGGFANFPCPSGYACVDDPMDSCDPAHGGADCGGVCVKAKKPHKKECADPARVYVADSPAQCMLVKYFCEAGTPFSDASGCGCDLSIKPCGGNTCGTGEFCCNPSCGICAPEGGFCTQQVCDAPI